MQVRGRVGGGVGRMELNLLVARAGVGERLTFSAVV